MPVRPQSLPFRPSRRFGYCPSAQSGPFGGRRSTLPHLTGVPRETWRTLLLTQKKAPACTSLLLQLGFMSTGRTLAAGAWIRGRWFCGCSREPCLRRRAPRRAKVAASEASEPQWLWRSSRLPNLCARSASRHPRCQACWLCSFEALRTTSLACRGPSAIPKFAPLAPSGPPWTFK